MLSSNVFEPRQTEYGLVKAAVLKISLFPRIAWRKPEGQNSGFQKYKFLAQCTNVPVIVQLNKNQQDFHTGNWRDSNMFHLRVGTQNEGKQGLGWTIEHMHWAGTKHDVYMLC